MKLETERLILRPLEAGDIDAMHSFWGNAENMSFFPEPLAREAVAGIIEKHGRLAREQGLGIWAVLLKETGALIGDCGITIQCIDGEDRHEIGYHFHRDHWGRGYATEAAQAMKRYGFEKLRLKQLFSYMEDRHEKSRRVAERNGMSLWKTFANPRNRDLPTTVYSISLAEYTATT